MNNLYLMYSQVNLIDAAAAALSLHRGEKNYLILCRSFKAEEGLLRQLETVFDEVHVVENIHEAAGKPPAWKLRTLWRNIRLAKKVIAEKKIDRMFSTQDGKLLDIFSMKALKRKNPGAELIYMEEGIGPYYIAYRPVSGTGRRRRLYQLRNFCLKYLFRAGAFFTEMPYESLSMPRIGEAECFDKNYFIYPELALAYLKKRPCVAIPRESVIEAVQRLYPGQEEGCSLGDGIVFALNKLDSIKTDRSRLEEIIRCVAEKAERDGLEAAYKYHPRETETLDLLRRFRELPKNVPLETVLMGNIGKNIRIVAINTTALYTAKIMGYEGISLIKVLDELKGNEEMAGFFEKMGIRMPETVSRLNEIL